MSFRRVPWRWLLLPALGALVGLLVAAWLHDAENRRWFRQQDSEVTQEANLLSRTLASSPDRQQWLDFVQGLRTMNWGEVEILDDATLSDRARQSLVVTPTLRIPEPNDYYRISVRQPIKDPSASAPAEWMLYSRRWLCAPGRTLAILPIDHQTQRCPRVHPIPCQKTGP
jgi:hypothetical protein